MLKAIIHNDDFGLNHAFTDAILACSKHGITTSTSIRTNGICVDSAVKKFKKLKKDLGLGLHVNLTDGIGHTTSLPHNNFIGYLPPLLLKEKHLLPFVQKEVSAQFKIAIDQYKLPIDHTNGHDHIHMIPPFFDIVAKISRDYGISYIRNANERFYSTNIFSRDIQPFLNGNILKFSILNHFSKENYSTLCKYNLKTADCFYGILHTGHMDAIAIEYALRHALSKNYKLVEILSHPTIPSKKDKKFTSEYIKNYTRHPSRKIELAALQSVRLKKFIKKSNIILTNYSKLANE